MTNKTPYSEVMMPNQSLLVTWTRTSSLAWRRGEASWQSWYLVATTIPLSSRWSTWVARARPSWPRTYLKTKRWRRSSGSLLGSTSPGSPAVKGSSITSTFFTGPGGPLPSARVYGQAMYTWMTNSKAHASRTKSRPLTSLEYQQEREAIVLNPWPI